MHPPALGLALLQYFTVYGLTAAAEKVFGVMMSLLDSWYICSRLGLGKARMRGALLKGSFGIICSLQFSW
jgi:hypothetical protein